MNAYRSIQAVLSQPAGPLCIAVRVVLLFMAFVWGTSGFAQSADSNRDARDLISERAWVDDPTNSLGPDDVRAMKWTPFTGPLRRGFQTSTTWIRLKIEPIANRGLGSVDREARLVLRMLPGHLDEIALFDPRRGSQPPLLAGDLHDWKLSEYRSFNQNLVIDAPHEPVEILIRLRTTTHHGIHIEALRWDDIEAIDRQQQLVIGAVITFLVMVLAWAVIGWIDRPDRVLAAFALHQLCSLAFSLAILGFFRVYLSGLLSPSVISTLTSATLPITASAVLWFHWHLMREFTPPALGLLLLKWLAILTPLNLLLMLAGYLSVALQITLIVAMLTPFMLLVLAIFAGNPKPGSVTRLRRRYLIGAYAVMTLILWNATLPAFGWLPSPPWAMYSAIAYGVVSALLLMGILRVRVRHIEAARRDTQMQLALTEQAVRQERAARQEQEQFMTMLTHELTNALATAHLAIGSLDPSSPMRARGYRAVDSMRDIVRRCAMSGAFEAETTVPQIAPFDIRSLVQEVCAQMQDDTHIRLNTDRAPGQTMTDRQLLSVVMTNLLGNALKYRVSGSVVELTVMSQQRDARNGLLLSVTNEVDEHGEPDRNKVFNKYWRGAGASRSTGSGLGLYLSSLIARRLGGDLQYQFERPFVRFVLWLPG